MRADRVGVSMMEILLAFSIFLVLLVPVYNSMSIQRRGVVSSDYGLLAQCQALEGVGHEEAWVQSHAMEAPRRTATSDASLSGWSLVKLKETVSCQPSSTTTGLFRIDMTLTWKDPSGNQMKRTHQVTKLVSSVEMANRARLAALPNPSMTAWDWSPALEENPWSE